MSVQVPIPAPHRVGHRRLWRWIRGIALVVIALPVVLGALGFLYQSLAEAADARAYAPPGQLVDVGGYRLHLYCTGEQTAGSPTVILEALFPGTVSNWVWVQPEIAKVTRVCAYDRAGHGWSDPGPEPRDAQQHARELHTLLQTAGISGPYVLVGHSLGGLFVRMYAKLYPSDVAGMVLIEGSHPDAWQRLGRPEGIGASREQLGVAPFLARLGLFRLGVIPIPRSDPDLPPRQFEELQAYFNTAKYPELLLTVDEAFPAMLAQVREAGKLGSIPLAVVVGTGNENGSGVLFELQQDHLNLSSDSVLYKVEGATHAGLADRQEHAMQSSAIILRVVEVVRTGQHLTN